MSTTDFLRRYMRHNLGLKLISLALAVGLWLAVANDPIAEVAVEVPIVYPILNNLEMSSEKVPMAQIRVRGPERIVSRLRASDVQAEIDLAGVKPGEQTFYLTAEQIHLPHDLEAVQVSPSQFQLTFEDRLTRKVKVQPRVIGSFAAGYRLKSVAAEPSVITISGPRKRTETVEVAITDPVDVSGTMERGVFTTHAYVPDPLVQVVQPEPIRITVIMEKVPNGNGGH